MARSYSRLCIDFPSFCNSRTYPHPLFNLSLGFWATKGPVSRVSPRLGAGSFSSARGRMEPGVPVPVGSSAGRAADSGRGTGSRRPRAQLFLKRCALP